MISPLRVSTILRSAALSLVTTLAWASAPRVWRPPAHGWPHQPGFHHGFPGYHYHGGPWYYGSAGWYGPWPGDYYGFYPPIGFSISILPFGFSTYWWGDVPYYYYGGVYYTDAPSGGYTVAQPPPERDAEMTQPPTGTPDAAALDALLISPLKGQTEEQMKLDRTNAQRFARSKSGYDPAHSDSSDPGTPRARQAYLRAMKSYLEGRGYSVN
jgi:hypothetical protein